MAESVPAAPPPTTVVAGSRPASRRLRAVLPRGGRATPLAQDRFVRWGVRAWAAVGMVLLGYLLLQFIGFISVLLIPLLVAGIIVFLLNPIVTLLRRWHVPRLLGAALAYVLVLGGVIGGTLWFALPPLAAQVRTAVAALPDDLAGAERRVEAMAAQFGATVAVDSREVQQWIVDNRDALLGSLTGLGAATASLIVVLALCVIGLVAAFYLLVDLPRLGRVAVAVVPPARREEVTTVGCEVAATVGGFLRGQIIVAAFVGFSTTLAMYLLGLPLWLFVGLVAGVTNLVPFIGPIVGGLLAVAIALANGDPLLALWVLLAIVVIQQVESSVVAPLVVGRTVELHPVVVLLAILVGGSLAGILGLLVAVPLAASARVLFRHIWVAASPYSDDLFPNGTADAQADTPAIAPSVVHRPPEGDQRPA